MDKSVAEPSDILSDDPAVLDGFRRGEPWALDIVYRAHVDYVAALVCEGTGQNGEQSAFVPGTTDPLAQCELVEEVFLRAFAATARNQVEVTSSFLAHLTEVAEKLLIQHHQQYPVRHEGTSHERRWDEQRKTSRAFVDTLSGEEQRLVALRYRKALSREVVAQQLGVSQRRVRAIEAHLRKGLRRYLRAASLWP